MFPLICKVSPIFWVINHALFYNHCQTLSFPQKKLCCLSTKSTNIALKIKTWTSHHLLCSACVGWHWDAIKLNGRACIDFDWEWNYKEAFKNTYCADLHRRRRAMIAMMNQSRWKEFNVVRIFAILSIKGRREVTIFREAATVISAPLDDEHFARRRTPLFTLSLPWWGILRVAPRDVMNSACRVEQTKKREPFICGWHNERHSQPRKRL